MIENIKFYSKKLKAAKIAKNAELIAQIDKQLAELQTYKSRQIRCARRKFEQYKIKERRKLEAKKIALFNKKLLNELSEHKSYALDDVKRALQEEIDKLRLTKELFDHEQLTEKKKLDALSSLQKKTIKDSKRRAKLRREIYKLKRKELLKAQMRTLSKRASEYTHKVNKNILEHTVESTRKMVRKTDRLQRKLNLLDSEIQHKKKLLQLESQDADTSIALERIQIQKLKNQYYMLQALRERQKAQNKVHKYMLKHNNKMEDLDEIESKSKIEMLNHVLQKKGIQKSVIEDTKQNSAAALKQLKAKLKKEYELKKKVLNLKRCLRTRLVVNDAVKRKEAENKMKDMVRKIVIARLKAMNNTCSPHNKLAKKVSK
ncbi:Progesterone-induced-blocking factor [Entamoeba marina]